MSQFIKSQFNVEGPQNERPSIINLQYVFQLGEMEHEEKYGIAFITAFDRVTAWWYENKEERDIELARIEQLIGTHTGLPGVGNVVM